jgi:hypothetical protein
MSTRPAGKALGDLGDVLQDHRGHVLQQGGRQAQHDVAGRVLGQGVADLAAQPPPGDQGVAPAVAAVLAVLDLLPEVGHLRG